MKSEAKKIENVRRDIKNIPFWFFLWSCNFSGWLICWKYIKG